VLLTLDSVIHVLQHMVGDVRPSRHIPKSAQAIGRDETLLKRHTAKLLGSAPQKRWTRFMVTMPSEAADEYLYVRDLLVRGMDCAVSIAHMMAMSRGARWPSMCAVRNGKRGDHAGY